MLIHSPKELALFFIQKRKKLKLSQIEVADLIGLNQKTISMFENKPEGTKLDTIFQILSAVNLFVRVEEKESNFVNKSQWKEEW